MDEACRTFPELAIPQAEHVDVHVRKLATGVRNAHIELENVQLD